MVAAPDAGLAAAPGHTCRYGAASNVGIAFTRDAAPLSCGARRPGGVQCVHRPRRGVEPSRGRRRSLPMPLTLARRLTGTERTVPANVALGIALAFVAGATNAGGFLAVHRYTSHMTGIVSTLADDLVHGARAAALEAVGALLSFVAGAMVSAVLVNFGRRHELSSRYAVPLLLEAVLLLGFGLLGGRLQQIDGLFVPVTILLLCFIMGLQNAVISKISNFEIRTTHITGTVTDIGIELGKLVYWNGARHGPGAVRANRRRLLTLSALACSFFVGGCAGAYGFGRIGYRCTVPLAVLLAVLAALPAFDDLKRAVAGRRRRR